jgi:endonuclease/exonuclease/phosphatase family metal-dependent hydrolase
MRLRVLTFNVWNEEGDPRRIEFINRELRRLDPDLVAFQEVVQTSERHQLAKLLEGTNLHGTHQAEGLAVALPGAERYGGNAIATRWPHKLVEVLDLRTADAQDVPWCTIAVSIAIPDAGELLFIGTTTAWRLNAESARERQVVALTDLDARHRRALPTIIAGDFNAAPKAGSIRYLTGHQSLLGHSVHYHDAWAVAGDGPGYTWTYENPNAESVINQIVRQPNHRRRVDYVFAGSWHAHPKAFCRVHSASLAFNQPIDGIWFSDHFGVVIEFEVGSDPQVSSS